MPSTAKERANRYTLLPTTQHSSILGANTLFDHVLARLLEDEGYDAKLLDACTMSPIAKLLDGAYVLLLAPYLDADTREALLNPMESTPEAVQRGVPILSLSASLLVALLDELAVNVSWQSLFKGLVQ